MGPETQDTQSLLVDYLACLDPSNQAPRAMEDLLALLAQTNIDTLNSVQRMQLLEAARGHLKPGSVSDSLLLRSAKAFPELAVEMLVLGANGRVVDKSRLHGPGVMQYLLENATALADTYGAREAQDLLRRALPFTYPSEDRHLMHEILVEAETNGWVMALAMDAMTLNPKAGQELLEACVLSAAPAPSLVEMAIAHGGDVFACFQPDPNEPEISVIEHAQRHPTPWAVDVFNRFAAIEQAKALQAQAVRETAGDGAPKRRF